MQLIIKITKKQNEKKSQCFSKKNIHVCVPPSIYQKKRCVNYENTESHGFMSMSVIVRILCSPSQSCFLKKSNENFPPPSFIPFKKSAKKYSLKIIWNGMKNENKIFLNLSQWCSVGHFSKTLLNFKIKSEQKTAKKSHPNPPSNHLLRTFKVWKIYILAAISSRFFSKF